MLNDSYISTYSSNTSGGTVFRNGAFISHNDAFVGSNRVYTSPSTSSVQDMSNCSVQDMSNSSISSNSCTVVSSSSGKLLPGRKYVQVHTLTGHTITMAVEVKCKLADVFTTVIGHVGVQDSRIFGLASKVDDEYRFHLDLSLKLSKITPKGWRRSANTSTDMGSTLYLRILLYVDHISLIRCPTSMLHYYQQLRQQSCTLWSDVDSICEDKCWELAALALQADFGDYSNCRQLAQYFTPEGYFPLWVINQRGLDYMARHMPAMHLDLEGMDRHEARVKFCREASRPPHNLNMHLFWLRKQKSAADNVLMAVAAKGLHLFETNKETGEKYHINAYSWGNIAKLAFEKRKFTLVGLGDCKKMTFYTSSDEKSRYMLSFCRKVHQFNMALVPEVKKAIEKELIEGHRFRESYIYSDRMDLEMVTKHGHFNDSFLSQPCSPTTSITNGLLPNGYSTLPPGYGVSHAQIGGQRVSVVSDASSNTTSGIVSDRLQIHDDSELDTNEDAEGGSGFTSPPLGVSQTSLIYGKLDPGQLPSYGNHNTIICQQFPLALDNRTFDDNARWDSRSSRSPSACSRGQGLPSVSDKTLTGGSEVDAVSAVDRNFDDEFESLSHKECMTEEERLRDLQLKAADTISLGIGSLLGGSNPSLRSRASINAATSTSVQVQHSRQSSAASMGSSRKVDIDELRHRTLNGYLRSNSGVNMTDESTQTSLPDHDSKTITISANTGRSMKTFATQTTGYYSCYKAKEEDKKGRGKKEHKAYRIVNAQKSFNENEGEDIDNHPLLNVIGLGMARPVLSQDVTVQCGGGSSELIIEPPPYIVRRKESSPLISPTNGNNLIVSDGAWYSGGDSSIYQHLVHWQSGLNPSSSTAPHYSASRQSHSMQNLNMEVRNPPGYNQAILQKQMQTANHVNKRQQRKKRWTTVSGIDEQIMQQAMVLGQRQPPPYPKERVTMNHVPLQQATSEPGIAQSIHCMYTTPGYSGLSNPSVKLPPPYYHNEQQRSVSTTQISSMCMDYAMEQMERNAQIASAANTFQGPGYTDSRVNLSRVQSMPGAANYNTRKPQEFRPPPAYIDAVTPKTCSSSKSKDKYCKSCQKLHTGGTVKMNISQIKAMLENHNLPMLTALCNETANEHRSPQNTLTIGSALQAPVSPSSAGSRPISWHDPQDLYQNYTQVHLDSNSNLVPECYPPAPSSPLRFSSTPNLSAVEVQYLPPPPPYGFRCNDSKNNLLYEQCVQRNQSTLRNAM